MHLPPALDIFILLKERTEPEPMQLFGRSNIARTDETICIITGVKYNVEQSVLERQLSNRYLVDKDLS